ncbi:hypothetical protein ACRYCC_26200 [Actinomadura scrupuli]|uniref:hypothetical protein n=1 Tax=Actinomadura scrupuli TaxID=559629 RepID=UPI003D98777E
MAEQSKQARIADALAAEPPEDAPGAMLNGWIVIAEWVDAEGHFWQTQLADAQSPSWRSKGLLFDALHGSNGSD